MGVGGPSRDDRRPHVLRTMLLEFNNPAVRNEAFINDICYYYRSHRNKFV